jgi:predicted CoA-binding protein
VLRGHLARALRRPALNEPELIHRLLETPGTWAVVGCSPDPGRDSHRIAALLQSRGHQVAPVNPAVAPGELLGERAYASVGDVPDPVTVVDVFRRSDQAGRHVDEAIEKGAQAVWLQLGVIDEAAAARAEAAGLGVVMDRCPAIEYRRLGF